MWIGALAVASIVAMPLFARADSGWQAVGTEGFSAGKVDYTSLAFPNNSTTPYIAYEDYGNSDEATVMKFDGTNWVNVGSPGFSAGTVEYTSLAFPEGSTTPYVAYEDFGNSRKATVMKFNGSSWVTVGTAGFSAGEADYTFIAFPNGSSTPYVVYADDSNGAKATVMKFDGSSWVDVGPEGFSTGTVNHPTLAFPNDSSTPYVVYGDGSNSGKATAVKFDGSSWVDVGSAGFSAGETYFTTITFPNGSTTPYVAYEDGGSSDKATMMKLDGSSWVDVGSAGFSPGGSYAISSAFSDESTIPYMSYQDVSDSNKATVMSFGTPAYTYTLSFNTEGGSTVADMAGETGGASITLPAAPTYSGYTFQDWNTASDGSGTSYDAGASYTMPSNDTTLYAIWRDTSPPTSWLTVPESGATVSGSSVTLTATSSDNAAVAGVTFYYDSTHEIGSEITATSSPNTYTTAWDTSALSSGSYTLTAVTRDTSNNYATSTAVAITVDNTTPAFSSIAASATNSGATLTWTTDVAASTKAVYSTDTSYASSTSEIDTSPRVTSHRDAVAGLLSCALYNYKVVSVDAYSNYATSTAQTFTTIGCPGGATPSAATSTVVTVSAAATSTITDSGRTLTVATPANFTATSSSVVIQIKGMNSDTVLGSIGKPSGLSSAAPIVFDVTALIDGSTVLDSFDHPVTITYHYTDADVAGLDTDSLTMYHYHDGAWIKLDDCSVDTAANTITCTTPSFSTFALFGQAATPAPDSTNNSSSSQSGYTIQGQVASLIAMGKTAEADALKAQWYWLFPQSAAAASLPTETANAPGTAQKCPYYDFTRTLQYGSTGEDVRALQQFLNCAGFPLAASGPGSPGHETIYFADLTLASIKAFQKAYASQILAPINLIYASGIFAQNSRAKAYTLMQPQ
ncbi:MAG: InlB B-repeat-containing protein [Ktedonobacteraceae bacterium]